MLKTFVTWLIKKLKANLRLIIQQMSKLKRAGSELVDGEKYVKICVCP